MKKMTKKDANEIYRIAKASLDNVEHIEYKVGDVSTTVEVYTRLALADINTVMTEVVVASFIDGEYNQIYRDAQLARCVIEYMTNLPLPTFKDENNKNSVDLNLCYEIVFGVNGLTNYCDHLRETLDEINHYITSKVIEIRKSTEASEQVFQKILDLYDTFKAELKDIKSNPAKMIDVLEGTLKENIEYIFDNHTEK